MGSRGLSPVVATCGKKSNIPPDFGTASSRRLFQSPVRLSGRAHLGEREEERGDGGVQEAGEQVQGAGRQAAAGWDDPRSDKFLSLSVFSRWSPRGNYFP
jgi:hypothetical protein